MNSSLKRLAVLCLLFSVISSLQWAPGPEDGEILYVCDGDDVTIPWAYNLTAGEEIASVEWLFRGASEEIVAMYSHGAFIPLPAFSDRVQDMPNGGLILRHVTKGDAGNFTIEIVGKRNTVDLLSESRTVTLQINDGLQTTDHQLHVIQEPDAVLDTASQEWSIVLTCGQFTYTGPPAFPVEWLTPSGSVQPSSNYHNGNFHLHLTSPVQAGSYICRVPQHHQSSACLHGNQGGAGQASVKVEGVEVSLLLMRAELRALRQDKEQLTQQLSQLRDDVTQENNRLRQQVNDLEMACNSSLNDLIQDMAFSRVAFSTHLLRPQHVSRPNHVKFDSVQYNHRNVYNSSTGDFTAPVSGLYVFYFQTQASSGQTSYTYVNVNGRAICFAYINDDNGVGSCQGITHLNVGDKVWVQPGFSNQRFRDGTTSFTGFLLSYDPQ